MAAPGFYGSVENCHRRIQGELQEIETITSEHDLLDKYVTNLLFFQFVSAALYRTPTGAALCHTNFCESKCPAPRLHCTCSHPSFLT